MIRWALLVRFGRGGKSRAYSDVSYCLEEAANDEWNEDPCSCSDELVKVQEGEDEEQDGEEGCCSYGWVISVVLEVVVMLCHGSRA